MMCHSILVHASGLARAWSCRREGLVDHTSLAQMPSSCPVREAGVTTLIISSTLPNGGSELIHSSWVLSTRDPFGSFAPQSIFARITSEQATGLWTEATVFIDTMVFTALLACTRPQVRFFSSRSSPMIWENCIATNSVVYFVWSVLASYARPPRTLWVLLESPIQFFLAKIILRIHNERTLSRRKKYVCCNWRKNQSRMEANEMVQRDWPQGRVMVRILCRRFIRCQVRIETKITTTQPLASFESCATLLLLGNKSSECNGTKV